MTKTAKWFVCLLTLAQALLACLALMIFGIHIDDVTYEKAQAFFMVGFFAHILVVAKLARSVYDVGLPRRAPEVGVFVAGLLSSLLLWCLTMVHAADSLTSIMDHSESRLKLLLIFGVLLGIELILLAIAFAVGRTRRAQPQ